MWEKRMEWPLNLAALLFLAAYAWPILDPTLGATARLWFEIITWGSWALFAFDYAVRLYLAGDKKTFLKEHVLDLLIIVLPLIRQLRLLRLVAVLNILNRSAALSLRGRVVVYTVGSTAMIVFCAALAVLEAERGAESPTIKDFPDAVWWAITTVTTVGYGDRYPVTHTGRIIAVGLMMAGIALLGVVTATLASWLIRRVAEAEETAQAVTREHLNELGRQIAELREIIEHGRGQELLGNGEGVHQPPGVRAEFRA
ncbi:potassium channel family protein [Amycolatopsis sp. cg5]|uniref:potassium channel family protein n=1 Tax=Amycolatopsis sp. cg5 TaxID=3238802 RepID=UPI003525F9EA